MAMNKAPSASPASKTGTMFGWSTAAAARISRRNRCRYPLSLASSGARIFSATCRFSRLSEARYTTAIPPRPICSSIV
jgi:hypothetical protein